MNGLDKNDDGGNGNGEKNLHGDNGVNFSYKSPSYLGRLDHARIQLLGPSLYVTFCHFFFGLDEWEKQTKQNLLLTLFFPPEASEQRCYNGHGHLFEFIEI